MQGWLYKQSKYLKAWRKRWTVIDNNQLVCYKEQTQITSTLSLNSKDIIFVESDNDKKYLFNIYVDTNSDKEDCYCFECESKISMDEWTSFIWSVLKDNNNKNRMVAFSSVLINEPLTIADIISSPGQPHKMSVLCYDSNIRAIYLLSIEHEKLQKKTFLFKLDPADNEQYDVYCTLQITSDMKYIAVCNTEKTIVTIFNVNDGTIHHRYHPVPSYHDRTEKICNVSFLTNQFIVIEYVQKVLQANHYMLESWEKYKYQSVCNIYSINDSKNVSTLIQDIESYDHIRTSKFTNKDLYARKYKNYNSKQNYMIINASLKTNELYPLDTLESSLDVDMSNIWIWLLDIIISPNGRYSVTVYIGRNDESYIQVHDLSNLLMDNASRRYCKCIYAEIYDLDFRDCAVFWLNNTTLIIWQIDNICNKGKKKMFRKGIQIRCDSCIPPLIEGIMTNYDIGDTFANIIAQIVWMYLKDDDDIIPSVKCLEFNNDSIIMTNIHGNNKWWRNKWTINMNKNVMVYKRNGKLKVIRYDF